MNTKQVAIQAPEFSFPVQLIKGFLAPYNALEIINAHKKLWLYFIIPFIINLILLSAIFYILYFYIYPFVLTLIPAGDAWYLSVLRWIIGPLLALSFVIIFVFLYSITGNIITAPVNDPLSAKVEELLGGRKFSEKFFFSTVIKDIIRILKNTIKLLFLLLIFNILIMLLNIIPLFGNALYSILSFLSALFFFGFSFFDFPLERRKLIFKHKFQIIWKFKYYCIGLGLSFFILSFIPVLGFLGLNLAAVGATDIFIKYIKPKLNTE
jgi:CysZ protein